MGEEQVVLEHDGDRPLLRGDEGRVVGVLQDDAVEHDPTGVEGLQAREGPEQRALPRPVRADDGDDAPLRDRQVDIEVQPAQGELDPRFEAHRFPSHRPWRPTSTATEMATMTRLSTSADSSRPDSISR